MSKLKKLSIRKVKTMDLNKIIRKKRKTKINRNHLMNKMSNRIMASNKSNKNKNLKRKEIKLKTNMKQ